ncbi:MAG TPA: flagellar export chaperone FliS [Candidatus Acidoferrum sp.]|jgi:flagellar protein FliS|nr:flagellar export chaperone FliS [Candidatus Acidoferrum sp.]
MNNDPSLSYQHAAARGASPVGEIVALYDTILRDFGRALVALQAGDIEARVFELNHAIVVIGYLQYVLDHERGAEPAKHLAQFYSLTRQMIVQANIRATPEPIQELIELYSGVRQAWHQADLQTRVEQTQPPVPATDRTGDAAAPGAANPANDDVETSQLQWSA